MHVITLTTDFGTKDGFVGVMKGVILGIAPEAKLVDISHEISPQNVREAAYTLARQVFYFPEGTIHVVVIDPGVGTDRRPIAAQIGDQYFVGPDNGVFSPLYEKAEEQGWPLKIVHTDNHKYWLDTISNVFHGRDIFSPVGAHLAAGVALEELGPEINDPVRFEVPKPQRTEKGWRGEVMHIDHFGNIASNIHRTHIGEAKVAKVKVNDVVLDGMVKTFGEAPVGELASLFSSINYVIVSEVNGNAAARLGTQVGDEFVIEFA
jgi:S-adenosylmethionine hydrolase